MYRGKDGIIEPSNDGTISEYCYSSADDWTLDDTYRYVQDYVLKEAYRLPTPANWDTSAYVYDEKGTLAIKNQLMQKRGVAVTFCADRSRPNETAATKYISENWAHYTYKEDLPNHGVTIVGWDDNYPAENFHHDVFTADENGKDVLDEAKTALTTPPANGAWLVKNSWGSGEQEFPNRGNGMWGIPVQKTDANGEPMVDENGDPIMVGSGYFWLSYYDQTISDPEAFVFDTDIIARGGYENRNTLHCNQYDLMPVLDMQSNVSDDLIKSANIFTTDKGEIVLAASYITDTHNTMVTVKVYLLNDGFTSPEDGVLVARNTQKRELAGFYIDYLGDNVVNIQPGQSYSVVVTQQQDTGKYAVDYPVGSGPGNFLIAMGQARNFSVAIQNDESHVYSNGTWKSWANEAVRDEFLKLQEETGAGGGMTKKMADLMAGSTYDNFPIKVYAIDQPIEVFARLADGKDKLSVCIGETPTVAKLELYGKDIEGKTIADFANDELISNE